MIDLTPLTQPVVLPVDCHYATNAVVTQQALPVAEVIDNFPPIPKK